MMRFVKKCLKNFVFFIKVGCACSKILAYPSFFSPNHNKTARSTLRNFL